MKIAFICSSGGHLIELLPLKKALKQYKKFWITFYSPITIATLKNEKIYLVIDPRRNFLKFLVLLFQSLFIFLKEIPDVVITTGAGVVIPFCIMSKIFGKKLIYIESFCRTRSVSLTGKILYYFANLFLVQWEQNLREYGEKAQFTGSIY